MKLEQTLFELATLVDYGTYYLSQKRTFSIDDLDVAKAREICDFLSRNNCDRYMLDSISNFEIGRYLTDNYSMSDIMDYLNIDNILDEVSRYDIKDFVKYNMDADEIYDDEDMLDSISPETILDYIANTDPDTIVEWVKGNYNTSDLIDVSGIDWK